MFCGNCGAKLSDGLVFCGNCGKRVSFTSFGTARKSVLLSPDVAGRFYTYHPRVFSRLGIGDVFTLEAVPGDLVITSDYNGSRLDTRESRMVAYRFNGEIVGASTCCYRMVRELQGEGYRVFCNAVKTGIYDRDVPTVTIYGTFKSDGYKLLDGTINAEHYTVYVNVTGGTQR